MVITGKQIVLYYAAAILNPWDAKHSQKPSKSQSENVIISYRCCGTVIAQKFLLPIKNYALKHVFN